MNIYEVLYNNNLLLLRGKKRLRQFTKLSLRQTSIFYLLACPELQIFTIDTQPPHLLVVHSKDKWLPSNLYINKKCHYCLH